MKISLKYASDEADFAASLIGNFWANVVFLFVLGFLVVIVQHFSPGFFVYPYLKWSFTPANIFAFWPLFVYCGFLAATMAKIFKIESDEEDGRAFKLGFVASVMAGLTEEIKYRWLHICVAMIAIVFLNWVYGTFLGYPVLLLWFLVGGLAVIAGFQKRHAMTGFSGILVIVTTALTWSCMGDKNPLLLFYTSFLVPVTNFVTLGHLKGFLYSNTVPPLFIFGMLSANANFRGRHKYQGIIGMTNAWMFGFVMIYATISYGIGTAIVLHMLYDIELCGVRYAMRKLGF